MKRSVPVEETGPRSGDPAVLVADNSKAGNILGCHPEKTLEYGISTAYAWENFRRERYLK